MDAVWEDSSNSWSGREEKRRLSGRREAEGNICITFTRLCDVMRGRFIGLFFCLLARLRTNYQAEYNQICGACARKKKDFTTDPFSEEKNCIFVH